MVERRREIDIAKTLSISQSTVSAEVNAIKQDSINELKAFLSQHLPIAFSISVAGVDSIISTIWAALNDNTQELRMVDRTNLMSLLLHCYSTRLEMHGDSETIVMAMEQMQAVKQQLAGMLPPDQVALMENRIASYQSGGIVTKEGELRQEQVLREQQRLEREQEQEQTGGANLNNSNGINSSSNEEVEELDDDAVSRKEMSSVNELSDNNDNDDNHSSIRHGLSKQQNDEVLSQPDDSSTSPTSNFKHGGNGSDKLPPQRPTRNKVF
jgi:hypothetical protein